MPGVRLRGARAVGNELKWGRPPGLRGTPWSRSSVPAFLVCVALTGAPVPGVEVPEATGASPADQGVCPTFQGLPCSWRGSSNFLRCSVYLGEWLFAKPN